MFRYMLMLYNLRYDYYKVLRNRALDKAKVCLLMDNMDMYNLYMKRALYYMKKIEMVTIETEQFIYG